MKNYQLQLKRIVGISTLALFVSAAPVNAQNDAALEPAQPATVQTQEFQPADPAFSTDVQSRNATDTSAEMQQAVAGSGREIYEPAGADNEKGWAWLGLLGLLGLFGMKRRGDVDEGKYRPLRT